MKGKFVLILALLLAGCAIPVGGDYYHPSAISGTVTRPYCHNGVGPENVIKFPISRSDLEVSADKREGAVTHINLLLSGEDFHDIDLGGDHVVVHDDDNGAELVKVDVKAAADPREFSYSFDINATPHKFEMTIPALRVGDKSSGELNITFVDGFGMWLDVPNC